MGENCKEINDKKIHQLLIQDVHILIYYYIIVIK